MKRVRIEKVKGRREPRWLEVLPLDPRDVDVLRAKAVERARRGAWQRADPCRVETRETPQPLHEPIDVVTVVIGVALPAGGLGPGEWPTPEPASRGWRDFLAAIARTMRQNQSFIRASGIAMIHSSSTNRLRTRP
jgi:hypothetical protein